MQRNAENVHSFAFGEALDRIYLLMIFLGDVAKEFSGELKAWLKLMWDQIDLSWIDEVDDRMMQEDRKYYAAA